MASAIRRNLDCGLQRGRTAGSAFKMGGRSNSIHCPRHLALIEKSWNRWTPRPLELITAMVKVLILTPVKDAAPFLDRYFENLSSLDRRGLSLSVGMLESDSLDATFDLAQKGLELIGDEFERAAAWRKPFGYRMPPGVPRWAHEHQYARRSVLARSRNHLLFRALQDEDWVLWLDVDVVVSSRSDPAAVNGRQVYRASTLRVELWRSELRSKCLGRSERSQHGCHATAGSGCAAQFGWRHLLVGRGRSAP